jgi:hypothetical protein
MIEQDIENTGGSLSPGDGKMMLPTTTEVESNGSLYVMAGWLKKDIAGLDPSVVRHGVLFEEQGEDYSFDRVSVFCASDNGTRLVGNVDNSNHIYRTDDNGATQTAIQVCDSGYSITDLATDGVDTWLATCHDTDVGTQLWKSTDDALTWSKITALPSYSGNIINGNTNQFFYQVCYYKDQATPANSRWLVVFTGETSNTNNGGIYWSADTNNWNRVQLIGTGYKGGYILPPQVNSDKWLFASNQYQSGLKGATIWVSNDHCASWTKIGEDGYNWQEESGIKGLYYAAEKYFLVISSSNDNTQIIEFDIDATNFNNFTITNRLYDSSEVPSTFINKKFNSHFEGVTYLGSGYATVDGVSFFKVRNGGENYSETDVPIANKTELWSRWESEDNNNKSPHAKSIPVAGSDIGYSEGGLVQYIKVADV